MHSGGERTACPVASRRRIVFPPWPRSRFEYVYPRMTSLDLTSATIAAALLLAAPVLAPARGEALGGPGSDRVRFELRGQIAPRCSLSGMPNAIDLGKIAAGTGETRRDLAFRLDCNAPFTYALTSTAAAMRREGDGPGGGAPEIPYRASLTIATDSGGKLRLACDGREIAAGEPGCQGRSGQDTAIGRDGMLSIVWTRPETPMAEGLYTAPIRLELGVAN